MYLGGNGKRLSAEFYLGETNKKKRINSLPKPLYFPYIGYNKWGKTILVRFNICEMKRLYSLDQIYPPEFGIKPEDGLHLTPLNGVSLLHLAVEYDEWPLLQLLVDAGMDVNTKAAVDKDGFGGHTALFHTVVSFTFHDRHKAELLLKNGANPVSKATLKKQLRYMGDPALEKMREFINVTPTEYASQFQVQRWVSHSSIGVIKEYM